ncbi:MAG: hypothetical protein LBL66_00335 [Clostridiales bacterium]|jgi:preprotein translocase subunit SecD|nr:hypothetical protein [Clostridiales bacterium]
MRKKAIIKLSAILTLIAAALVFTFLPIDGIVKYRGVAGTAATRFDAESGGGMYAVYQARVPDVSSRARYVDQLNARMFQQNITVNTYLQNANVSAAVFSRQGSDRIRVQVGITEIAPICELMERKIELAVLDSAGVEVLEGSHITNARIKANQITQNYELFVELDAEGAEALAVVQGTLSVIDKASRDLYGGEEGADGSEGYGYKLIDGLALAGSQLTVENSDSQKLNMAALRIVAGARPLELKLVGADAVSATDAERVAKLVMWGTVAAAVLVLAFLLARYRGLGLLAAASFLACSVLLAFFMAVLPFSKLSFAAVAAMAVCFILNLVGHIALFERVKEEYALGKSAQASIASAFKRLLWPLLDIHILAVAAGAALWLLGEGAAAGFGTVLLMGAALSCAATLAFTRYLIRLAIQIYGDGIDAGKLALKRPANFKDSDRIPDPEPKTEKTAEEIIAPEAENV